MITTQISKFVLKTSNVISVKSGTICEGLYDHSTKSSFLKSQDVLEFNGQVLSVQDLNGQTISLPNGNTLSRSKFNQINSEKFCLNAGFEYTRLSVIETDPSGNVLSMANYIQIE